jgi:hypothetical protein
MPPDDILTAMQQKITAAALESGEFAAIISSHEWRVLITLHFSINPYSKQ